MPSIRIRLTDCFLGPVTAKAITGMVSIEIINSTGKQV